MDLEPIEVAGDPPVLGVLHAADGPDGLVLTHGAGGNKNTPLLVAVAEAFAARGVTVLRCDLPYRQIRPRVEPATNSLERDGEQLRIEPGAGLLLACEENLHLLPTGIDVVVALIFVVVKSREVPDAVAQRTHVVHRAKRGQQLVRTCGKRALECGKRLDGHF